MFVLLLLHVHILSNLKSPNLVVQTDIVFSLWSEFISLCYRLCMQDY